MIPEKYTRLIPRVAAIHDLCGYGNCSLCVALPVLSAGGIDAVPVPTAVLSAHTGFPNFTFLDTTAELEPYFANWAELEVHLDGVYTGFLGSTEQIGLIINFIQGRRGIRTVIDPVMGDHGKIYATYTPEMCAGMKDLAAVADVLTPNLTEAAVLLDLPYPGQQLNAAESRDLCSRLQQLGAKNIVLKGIDRQDEQLVNCVLLEDGTYEETANRKIDTNLHGTGDLFASIVTAGLFAGRTLIDSTDFAGHTVRDAIELSRFQPGFKARGVSFEPLLGEIARFCLD